MAFILYLFRLLLKAAEFITAAVVAQWTALLAPEVASTINWARSAKPNYWHCQSFTRMGLVLFWGFFFWREGGGINLTIKTFASSALNSYPCWKESFLFLCLLVTFQFHTVSIFSKDDGGGKMPVQFDHCCLKSSFSCSEEMLLSSFWFTVERLLIFSSAGYRFACTLFVMHTQVVEWVLAN